MISKQTFDYIENEVISSLKESFNLLKERSMSSYLLFIANGEFNELLLRHATLSPYTIESPIDNYLDYDRLAFLRDLLQTFYSFGDTKIVDDNIQRMHLELMTYTHIWESQPFLKKLYRIAQAIDSSEYIWEVKVPRIEKYKFIKEDIREVLEQKQCNLAEIIEKGYHSSLRNAFAHSQYHFDEKNKIIHLSNYSSRYWEIKEVTFNDWNVRFAYSALLTYHLYHEVKSRKERVYEDFDTIHFNVNIPNRKRTEVIKKKIRYCRDKNEFYWE